MSTSTDTAKPKLRKQLYLTQDALRQGQELKAPMCRPSFSNVVEALIDEEHKRRFPNGSQSVSHVEQTTSQTQAASLPEAA